MDDLIFVGNRPQPSKINPIHHKEGYSKPEGGFWTSPYDPEYISAFIRYEQGALVQPTQNVWKIQMKDPRPEDILRLTTVEEIEQQPIVWNRTKTHSYLDFEKIFSTYDVIYVDEDLAHRKGLSSEYSLRGWDVETYLWKDLSYVTQIDCLGTIREVVPFVN